MACVAPPVRSLVIPRATLGLGLGPGPTLYLFFCRPGRWATFTSASLTT